MPNYRVPRGNGPMDDYWPRPREDRTCPSRLVGNVYNTNRARYDGNVYNCNFNMVKKKPTNWRKGKICGRGTFGDVYHVTMTAPEGVIELAVKEIKIHEIYRQKSQEGSLSKFIYDKQVMDEIKARLFTKQLLEDVAYLHGIGLFHRDIKCDNVLVFDEDNIKLADFGLAKVYEEITQTYTKGIGTIRFMAPEMIKNQKYNKQVDIWSVGCVAVNMLTGQVPFHELEEQQVMFCVGHENRSPVTNILPQLPDCSKTFFEKTFQADPKQRPSAESLLTDSFISGIYYSKQDLQWKEKRLDLLLVGTCENSKRKNGISITGENIFKIPMRRSSSESSVLKGSTQFEDYTINVVELPDIDENVTSNESLENFQNLMRECFKYCDDGFSALIFVPSYTNILTNQEIEMLHFLRTTLGSDVVKKSMICFFCTQINAQIRDTGVYAQRILIQAEYKLSTFLAECNQRWVLSINTSKDKTIHFYDMKGLVFYATQTKTYTKNDYIAATEGRENQKLENLSAKVLDDTQELIKRLRIKMTDSERIKDLTERVNQLESIINELKDREEKILYRTLIFKNADNPIDLIFELKVEIESKIKLLEQRRRSIARCQDNGDYVVEEAEEAPVRGEPKRLLFRNRKRNTKEQQRNPNANSKSKKSCHIL
ncbi:Mitogen-activated protein kinase kinase kinase 1 [Bulinus truncatus]|nr:Mitogen-activated protein kinase kinase kinase 1 [Bulinus truncatus]